jgi:opacity protein-like surface antigen
MLFSIGSPVVHMAAAAAAAAVQAVVAGQRVGGRYSVPAPALQQEALPLDVALSNGRPTVVEVYASW